MGQESAGVVDCMYLKSFPVTANTTMQARYKTRFNIRKGGVVYVRKEQNGRVERARGKEFGRYFPGTLES